MDYFSGLLMTSWWPELGLVHSCFVTDYAPVLVVCYGQLVRYEIVDCFKVLLLDFVITCLIVLADIYILICWQLDEMFGNYTLLT